MAKIDEINPIQNIAPHSVDSITAKKPTRQVKKEKDESPKPATSHSESPKTDEDATYEGNLDSPKKSTGTILDKKI